MEVVPLTLVKEGEEWEVWLPYEAEEYELEVVHLTLGVE